MKRILIAEDNDSNFILMTYILRQRYEYDRARNGKEAVEMTTNTNYDLVLMDLKMPVMDGLEATRQLKAMRPQLPVVALTANAFEQDREMALEAGCDDFMTKPISQADCLALIAKYIG